MNRTLTCAVNALAGLTLILCGLLSPAHLRAVDGRVLRQAGRITPGLLEKGAALVGRKNLGAAQLLLHAAQDQKLTGAEILGAEVTKLQAEPVPWHQLGAADAALQHLFAAPPAPSPSNAPPFTELVIRRESRARALEFLQSSRQPAVQELMRCRGLTNTVLLPPASSASGQAFDAALIICGLLLQDQRLTVDFSRQVQTLAANANRGAGSQELEQVLLDVMSLGQRLNWGQLTALLAQVREADTVRTLTGVLRSGVDLPTVFAAVQLTGQPAAVTQYCLTWSRSGVDDLGRSLQFNTGGVDELVRRNLRLITPGWREAFAKYNPFGAVVDEMARLTWLQPGVAIGVKWTFFIGGGFLLALAGRQARRAPGVLERPLQVRGFHVAWESLFGLGLLTVLLLLSEPFLAQESQKVELPFRLRLPTVVSAVPAGKPAAFAAFMNQVSLLTLSLFFVLQALIYIACLLKLAEIRRQRLAARMKIRLLENEEHLFDAGLYLGFGGTIISLILVSLGVVRPSLMAAYSSTSFGIIFVSIFKIFNLRPAKRQLLLEAENDANSASARGFAPTS